MRAEKKTAIIGLQFKSYRKAFYFYIMVVRYPLYLSKFQCAAGACPDTCCQGWDISIDPKTLACYRRACGNLGRRIHQGVDFKRGCLVFQNGVCPFLDGSGLCSLQKEGGVHMISKACRLYPRHVEEYGSRREWSLSFSCPEVARIILSRQEPIIFAEKMSVGKGRPDSEIDRDFLEVLLEIRRVAIEIGQDRKFTMERRMAMVLAFVHDVQKRLDSGKRENSLGKIRKYLERFCCRTEAADKKFEERCRALQKSERDRENLLLKYRDTFYEFAVIENKWKKILSRLRRWEAGGRCMEKDSSKAACGLPYEHILVSYLDLYLPGAVYDGDVLSKVKLAVYHCLALHMLEGALGIPLERLIHIYAREIEHSAGNLEYLEEMVKNRQEFDVNEMIASVYIG